MKTINYSNKPGSRMRGRSLVLRKDGKLYDFNGKTIPGIAVITSSRYIRNGKWSHTNYEISIGDDVKPFFESQGFDTGRYFGEQSSFAEVAEHLGVDVEEVKAFLDANFQGAFKRFSKIESELAELNSVESAPGAILNLTQHPAIAEQVEAGVVNVEEEDTDRLKNDLTFDSLPDSTDLVNAANNIATLAEEYKERGVWTNNVAKRVMIGGAPFFMTTLESVLKKRGFIPMHAFSTRQSVEREVDGKMIKQSIFKHEGFLTVE